MSGIAATVTGFQALRRASNATPPQARRGLAIAGLVIGIVCLVIFLCACSAFAVIVYSCRNGC